MGSELINTGKFKLIMESGLMVKGKVKGLCSGVMVKSI